MRFLGGMDRKAWLRQARGAVDPLARPKQPNKPHAVAATIIGFLGM